jgi:hypothetical protein
LDFTAANRKLLATNTPSSSIKYKTKLTLGLRDVDNAAIISEDVNLLTTIEVGHGHLLQDTTEFLVI